LCLQRPTLNAQRSTFNFSGLNWALDVGR
jgi:hypothetical protein